MKPLSQIICSLDFSEPSMHALHYAASLGRQLHLPLTLVHVLMPLPIYPSEPEVMMAFTPAYYPDETQRESNAREQLEALKKQLEGPDLPVTAELLNGPPGTTLVEWIGQESGALLVMGTHGYRGFQRFVLGSTTVEVLRRAPCPILTVREAHTPSPTRRIGVAVDFSAACEPAIEAAASLARAFGATLDLIHVMAPVEIRGTAEARIPVYVTETNDAAQGAVRRELEEIAARLPGIRVNPVILVGTTPYRDLMHYIESMHLDMLAIGTHGRTGLKRLFLGSVTERVLQLSACPVLSVKLPTDVPERLNWRDVVDDLKRPTPG